MTSLVDRGLEKLGSGRKRIGLQGEYQDKIVVIEFDCTSIYTLTESATVTQHPIESEQNGNLKVITDYVIPVMPAIDLEILLSDNLGLEFSLSSSFIKNNSVSLKDKIKILTSWQKTGSVLNLLGYTTGQGKAGKFLNGLTSGIQNFFDSKEPNAYYTGLDRDTVTDIVLGNIVWKRKIENGLDVEASIKLQKIHRAIAKVGTISRNATSNARPAIANQGKQETKPVPKEKVSSVNKKLSGTPKK
jgi:hypothetical protein